MYQIETKQGNVKFSSETQSLFNQFLKEAQEKGETIDSIRDGFECLLKSYFEEKPQPKPDPKLSITPETRDLIETELSEEIALDEAILKLIKTAHETPKEITKEVEKELLDGQYIIDLSAPRYNTLHEMLKKSVKWRFEHSQAHYTKGNRNYLEQPEEIGQLVVALVNQDKVMYSKLNGGVQTGF